MISINISELIWTVINFFLLLFLLNRFLYQPVIRFMEDRQARIDGKLAEEQDARSRVTENEQRLSEMKTAQRAEAKRLLEQMHEEQEQIHDSALQEARRESVRNRKGGETALQQEKELSSEKLHEAVPELAELLTKRLLSEN